jgi:integrase/recombinase XerD
MSTPVITIFVRHAEDCKQKSKGEFCKACQCRKHLRWFANGVQERLKTGTRSWAEAEKAKRNLEDQLSGKTVVAEPEAKTLQEAVDLFLAEKRVSNVSSHAQKQYALELGRVVRFCEQAGVFTVQGMTRELLTAFCGTWPTLYKSSFTRMRVRERLQSFIKFCYDSEWLRRKLPLPAMANEESPTLPLTADEYARLLSATTDKSTRALIQLMRWTGLAVRDASTLERAEIVKDDFRGLYRVVTEREKTGTHVSVVLKPSVVEEVLAMAEANANKKYIFFSGTVSPQSFAQTCGQRIVRAFDAAGIVSLGNMKSHRLRDTFAVDLLEKGVPMEEVSKLLGHESIRTTEKHYAKWVKGRQDRLDTLVSGTWGD